jgi:hypothetical protein
MNNTILIVTLILFGISAVFRLITHILEIRERNESEGSTNVEVNARV